MRSDHEILLDYFAFLCNNKGYEFERIKYLNYNKGKIGGAFYGSKDGGTRLFEKMTTKEVLYNFELERSLYDYD